MIIGADAEVITPDILSLEDHPDALLLMMILLLNSFIPPSVWAFIFLMILVYVDSQNGQRAIACDPMLNPL